MGTAIKHPVPDRVKPSFVIFDIRALSYDNSRHQRVKFVIRLSSCTYGIKLSVGVSKSSWKWTTFIATCLRPQTISPTDHVEQTAKQVLWLLIVSWTTYARRNNIVQFFSQRLDHVAKRSLFSTILHFIITHNGSYNCLKFATSWEISCHVSNTTVNWCSSRRSTCTVYSDWQTWQNDARSWSIFKDSCFPQDVLGYHVNVNQA